MSEKLTPLIRLLFYILLFFTPLIFTNNTKELFEFSKMFFVYFLGSTVIFLFALRYVLEPFSVKKPNGRLFWFIAAFVIANLVSTTLSSHFYTSVWGYYSRFNGGMLSVLVFFGIYIVGKNVLEKHHFETGLYAGAFSLVPIGLLAVYQHFTLEKGARVYSTFGQANWLAAYVSMLLPFVLYSVIKNPKLNLKNNSTKEKGGSTSFFLIGTFILGYITLWFTYSLSGILGFIVGIGLFLVLNAKLVRSNKVIIGSIFSVCILLSLLFPGIYLQRIKDVVTDTKKLKTSVVSKTVQAQETPTKTAFEIPQISDPGYIRTYLWRGTIDLITSSPKIFLIGIGPETFPYEFQKHRPAELNLSSEWNYILNKPHNYYLEVFAESGVFALISYIGIMFFVIKRRHVYLTPGLCALFVSNFFGFPVVATSLLFWFFVVGLT